MSEPVGPDMNAPITRGEMYEALEIWAGNIEARLGARLSEAFDRLRDDLAAQMRGHKEDLERLIRGMDDKYTQLPERVTKLEELPARVTKLEAKVFAPKRGRSSAQRRSK
jgi:BMFP domain-containing protein YqiC